MEAANNKVSFNIPARDLDSLSFCSTKPKLFKEWVEALPKANVGETSKRLYLALQEMNRLKIDDKERFLLLELLYPVVDYVCHLLAPHYLNQPLILPAKAQKVSNLASALQGNMALGYTSVVAWSVVHRSSLTTKKETSKIATQAIARAINCHNQILLRAYQLYRPAPINIWKELYTLYTVAEQSNIEDRPIHKPSSTPNTESNSIKHELIRALLLSTCKPNMLRQTEIAQVFMATLNWALWAELCVEDDLFGLFKVDLLSNSAPTYLEEDQTDGAEPNDTAMSSSAMSSSTEPSLTLPSLTVPSLTMSNPTVPSSTVSSSAASNSAMSRSLFTADLVPRLNAFINSALSKTGPEDDFQLPDNIQPSLLKHLASVWDTSKKRTFDRTETSGTLELCVGFSALYFYVSDGKDFQTQLRGGKASNLIESEDNPFLNPTGSPFKQPYREETKSADDVWSLAYDAGGKEINKSGDFNADLLNVENIDKQLAAEATAQQNKSYPSYQCNIVDTSPGGYCIGWMEGIPSQIRTGEIIGIKEPNQNTWAIAVIRWVTQAGKQKAKLGIELLSPEAKPCGAKVIQKTGQDTDYLRALKLPAIKAIDQPASLLMPNISFRPNTKIVINLQGQERRACLIEQIDTTAGYSQFAYNFLEAEIKPELTPDSNQTPQQKGDDFDTLWSSL